MIITGTRRGLGLELTKYYLGKGYRVFGCSRKQMEYQFPVDAAYMHTQVDLCDEKAVRQWVRTIKTEAGHIDILINNAGLVESALFMSITPSTVMESLMRNNFFSLFHISRETAKTMALRQSGRIITINSILSSMNEPGTSVYAAAKSAVVKSMKVLAVEMAPVHVTSNVISPGMLGVGQENDFGEEWKTRMLGKQVFPRPITVEEICHTVDFLISPTASSITGQVIHLGIVD